MEAKAQYEINQDSSIINSLKRLLYNEPRTENDFDVYLVIKNNNDSHINKRQINNILCQLDCNDLGATSDGKQVFKTFQRRSLPQLDSPKTDRMTSINSVKNFVIAKNNDIYIHRHKKTQIKKVGYLDLYENKLQEKHKSQLLLSNQDRYMSSKEKYSKLTLKNKMDVYLNEPMNHVPLRFKSGR